MPVTQAKLDFQTDLKRTTTPALPDDVSNKSYVDAAIALATPDATAASGGGVKGIVSLDSDKALGATAGVAGVKVDGTTIGFDGSGNLVSLGVIGDATSAPGGGTKGQITADENKGLKIATGIMEVYPNTSKGLQTLSTGLEIKVDAVTIAFDGAGNLQVIGGGGGGGTQVSVDKNLTALPTLSDNNPATSTPITSTPVGFVRILVNGIGTRLGNGVKVGVPCYFSADGGATARTIAAITAGDVLYWNGSIALYQLDASDRIDFDYEV